jgi:hypothetical protein
VAEILFCLWGHHDGMMRGCGSGKLGESGAGGDVLQCNTRCKAAALLPAPKLTTISKYTTIQQVYIIKKLKNTSY